MPRCPPGSLRSVQLPLDHLGGEMSDRAVCHQRRSGRRSHGMMGASDVVYVEKRRGNNNNNNNKYLHG